MADCKRKLAGALEDLQGSEEPPAGDDPQAVAHYIARTFASGGPGSRLPGGRPSPLQRDPGPAGHGQHEARRSRGQAVPRPGIPYSDLLQDGFCGLLEAIDRFDLIHQTKLATYATWWIRQSMQQAVASGAYPVRLTPRHLRQLAQNQEAAERRTGRPGEHRGLGRGTSLTRDDHRIHARHGPRSRSTRPSTVDSSFTLLQTMSDPEGDPDRDVDTDEAVERLVEALRPREQEVLSLRFGLGGRERLSLSQVGTVARRLQGTRAPDPGSGPPEAPGLAERENLVERLAL